jgi:hypothetical protein
VFVCVCARHACVVCGVRACTTDDALWWVSSSRSAGGHALGGAAEAYVYMHTTRLYSGEALAAAASLYYCFTTACFALFLLYY